MGPGASRDDARSISPDIIGGAIKKGAELGFRDRVKILERLHATEINLR